MFEMASLVRSLQDRTEQALDVCLPSAATHPARLHEAMRHSALGGGKRLRPILVYATGRALGVSGKPLDAPACAVELIHVYSLIHDDLPAMDDDDLRRGKPTCHKAFDEATAILAGDAMQSLAFQILATDLHPADAPAARLKMIEILARASGSRGMAGGQAIDLASVGRDISFPELEDMHIHKTGALIRASVLLGALAAGPADAGVMDRLDRYAKCIGLAFQIRDDILDVEGDTATLGKKSGADIALEKPTYPALLGMEAAKEEARSLVEEAKGSLAAIGGQTDLLHWVADYVIGRIH